jgi:hypothetical protein
MLLRDGIFKRKLTCAICGAGLDHKRVGRIRKFCSDRCRDEARRDRDFVGSFGSPPTEVARTHETAENTPTNSMACKGEKRDRASPLDLLGHGFRWSGATAIDPELRRRIVETELGTDVVSSTLE